MFFTGFHVFWKNLMFLKLSISQISFMSSWGKLLSTGWNYSLAKKLAAMSEANPAGAESPLQLRCMYCFSRTARPNGSSISEGACSELMLRHEVSRSEKSRQDSERQMDDHRGTRWEYIWSEQGCVASSWRDVRSEERGTYIPTVQQSP